MKRLWLVPLLALCACSGDAPVQYDYNPTADFSAYRTFSFQQSTIEAGETSVARDPRVLETIRDTVVDELATRPLTSVPTGGDLEVAILVAAGEETGVDQWGMNWDAEGGFTPGGETFQYKAGTLVIDFFDRATGQLVWRGWAHSGVTRTDEPDLELLSKVVVAMLANYPPSDAKD